jgi:hypothetical protein
MKYVELGFVAKTRPTDRELPPFLGATLRGALGIVLKQTVCQVAHGMCDECLLRIACPYPMIFEGLAPIERAVMRRYDYVPQPFVLLVTGPNEPRRQAGQLKWGIRLFGSAARYWPYVVHTFTIAGERGIGSSRTQYDIEHVTDGLGGDPVCVCGNFSGNYPTLRTIDWQRDDFPDYCALRWRFSTPLRIRENGNSIRSVDGLGVLLAGRRRFEIMRHFYGDDEEAPLPEPTERFEADAFVTRCSSLQSWGFSRYSGRQHRRMALNGLIGDLVIEGPWGRTGQWLHAVSVLHLGKATSFGFGRVLWEIA